MGKTHKKTKRILNENWSEIVKLISAGWNLTDIARKYGIYRSSLAARLESQLTQAAKPKVPVVQSIKTVVPVSKPQLKVLILDIENAPMMSYHWGLWKQNISRNMRVEGNRSYMMSVSMKWLGEDEVYYFETRTEDDSELLRQTLKFVDEADIVVGHNAKNFDMKKINSYAILNGMAPPSPYRVVDTMLVAKKEFAFEQNTLEYLTNALCTQTKSSHGKFRGFDLWSECMKGNEEAWEEMQHYNKQDVIATEELYLKLRPWTKGHPNVVTAATTTESRCASCGSARLKRDGYSFTNVSKFKRYRCEDCNSFSRGRKNVLTKADREHLLAPVVNG